MRRRKLLTVGLAGGALLAVAGALLIRVEPARREGRLTDAGRGLLAALAPAVLTAMLPAEPAARQAAITAHVQRVDDAIQGMPPAMQAEVDELLTLAASGAGRLALVGLGPSWGNASVEQIQAALAGMRDSSLALRQQAFHALRDLTSGSYFADESTWAALGYPGPLKI